MSAVLSAPGRLVQGFARFARFLGAALGLFDRIIPRFRLKTALVATLEILAAVAAGMSWTMLVPFLQHLTGGTTQALPDGAFANLYRFFGERLNLLTVSYLVFGAVVLKNGLTFASQLVQYRMVSLLSHQLRSRVFAAYVQSDLKFFEQAQDGRFISVFNNEIERTKKILTVWRRAISGTVSALVYLTLLFLISSAVTWLFLGGGCLLLLGLMRFYYLLREGGFAVSRLNARLNAKIAEMIRCFILVKSLGTEAREHAEFDGTSRRYADAEFTQSIFTVLPGMVIETAAYAALLVTVIGTLIGLFAGYFRGWVDDLLMRLVDLAYSIPFEPFAIVMVGLLRPSIWTVIIAISLLTWRAPARVIRAQVLSVTQRPFIKAARVAGASPLRIIFAHIAPNILPLTFVYMTIEFGIAIVAEASVSFLGFGDPHVESWGKTLHLAFLTGAIRKAWWWAIPPGLCITLIVLSVFFISRAWEEVINPRLRRL